MDHNVKVKPLSYAVFSDNHVNGRNPVDETLKQLDHLIIDNPKAKQWDLIWWSGDFFDRCASFVDNDIFLILGWIRKFLNFAKDNNIAVRVLRGTPSHDWNQAELFEYVAHTIGDIDFKYHKRLEIDYIDRIKAHVLYIPDEWASGPEETWLETQEALKAAGLKKVDYGITHGFFDFQIPGNLPPGVTFTHHKSKRYLSVVKRAIFNGHDHTRKEYRIIRVPGSTNRNKHGEEEDKGYYVGTIGKVADDVQFVVNDRAHQYFTIDVRGMTQDEGLAYVKAQIDAKGARDGASIRLEVNSDDAMSMSVPALKKIYPTLKFDPPKRHEVVNKDDKKVEVRDIKKVEILELRPENFMTVIGSRMDLTPEEAKLLESAL